MNAPQHILKRIYDRDELLRFFMLRADATTSS